MNKIIVCLIIVFSGGLIFVNAQNVEFKAANFKDNKEGLKSALENIKNGDDLFKQGEEKLKNNAEPEKYFKGALEFYLKSQEFNPDNAELNYKIGKCYLNLYEKSNSLKHLENSVKLDPDLNDEMYFLLGQAYQYNCKFKEAKEQYKIYEGKIGSGQAEDLKVLLKKRMQECDAGAEFYAKPERVWVNSVKEINSEYADFCAAISADESMMIFNSRRPENVGGKRDENDCYYSDIYVSYRNKGKWSQPKGIGAPLNTDGEDECLALSPNGQSIYVYKNTNGNGDIYRSDLNGEKWSDIASLADKRINTEFNETHAGFSYDGIKVYFISDQQGEKDIYFSGVRAGDWGKGQKIGDGLNSSYDEGSIYMHPNDRVLYFASKGFNSMGGYDIFKSTRRYDGMWMAPVNMGYPVNTPYDDIYFVISANGKNAYVTSNRENGAGDFDIYKVRFLGNPKPSVTDNEDHLLASFAEPVKDITIESAVKIESTNLTVLKGRVLDDFTNASVKADIEIVDNVKNLVIFTTTSNSTTGKFLVSLPSGINYGIAVKAQGYLFHSENFDLPELTDYQLIDKDIRLQNIAVGNKVVLKNIFFDVGKSTIRPESTMELNRLIKLLNDIPSLKIEISGHTDNVGSSESNQQLSESRAKAVVNYLIKSGINSGRLVYKGYGFSRPVASNDTPEGRQLNRRTEFEIIKN